MQIIRIEIMNNKKIKVFSMSPQGENIEIAGNTGAGKTTGISALWEIMGKHPLALRNGAKKGSIEIELKDENRTIMAKRSFTPKTNSICITDGEDQKISIGDFKKMISDLAIDPHKIINLKPKDQVNTLLKSANIGDVDLDKIDADIAALEEKRLNSKRAMDILKPAEEPEKVDVVNIVEIIKEKQTAEDRNIKNSDQRVKLMSLRSNNLDLMSNVKIAEEALETAKEALEDAEEKLELSKDVLLEAEKTVELLVDIDTAPFDEKINTCQRTNQKAEKWAAWRDSVISHNVEKNKYDGFQKSYVEKQNYKKSILEKAKWPIPGLGIKDGQIYYNGFLLNNLGDSEQMLVCAALAIEDIKNHPIKVVRMNGIEAMSKKDFEQLQKLFNGHGIQVLSTRVSRGDVEPQEIMIVAGVYSDE